MSVLTTIVVLLLWLLLVLLLLILVVLCTPFVLIVDSTGKQYGVTMFPWARAFVQFSNFRLALDLHLLGYHYQRDVWSLSDSTPESKKTSAAERTQKVADKKRTSTKKKRNIPWRRIVATLRTFDVQRCEVHIDTGVDEWNVWLYPISYLLAEWTPLRMQPNFDDRNSINLRVRNSGARIALAFLFPSLFTPTQRTRYESGR